MSEINNVEVMEEQDCSNMEETEALCSVDTYDEEPEGGVSLKDAALGTLIVGGSILAVRKIVKFCKNKKAAKAATETDAQPKEPRQKLIEVKFNNPFKKNAVEPAETVVDSTESAN